MKIAALVLIVSINSAASSVVGPISHAMGNTGRASVLATESIFLNPAFVALAQGYHLGLGYYNTELDKNGSKVVNLSVTDSTKSTMFPAALAVTRSKDSFVEQTLYSLASGAAYTKWSWGFTYKHNSVKGVRFQDKSSIDEMDFGLLFNPSSAFNFALVGTNLLNSEKKKSAAVENAPSFRRKVSGAMTFLFENHFRLQADISKFDGLKKNDLEYGLGMDTSLHKFFSLRLGWAKNEVDDTVLGTTGLAFLGPRLALNYAFSKDFQGVAGNSHRVDFSLPF